MATVSSTSLLSRTRSGRLPSGKPAAGHDAVTAPGSVASAAPISTSTSTAASSLLVPASYVAVFLTNLRLLDLDLRPDWPGIGVRTFAAKDATQGQKRRIQSVEWALYHLFCYWDPDEAHAKMQPFFPPTDQVQSVHLRAAFLRALETAKKTGALGRDAILRKTMLDECRGERFEEILAVFSSAVLKRVVEQVVQDNDMPVDMSVAHTLALENRGYAADRTQLYALILAHKASLSRTLRHKAAARARYRDFAELLALKERSVARRRELAREDEDNARPTVSDDAQLRLQRLVRNNWSGSEPWMKTLVHGDEHTRKDGLLSTPPDRVWRRVQAGRLGELESKTESGLLDQLDRRVSAQTERLHRWQEYSRHVLGTHQPGAGARTTKHAPDRPQAKKTTTGIDFGFDAHNDLHPTVSPQRGKRDETPALPRNDDYAELLRSFQRELDNVNKPGQGPAPLASFLEARKAAARKIPGHARNASRAVDVDDVASDISDIDEHPIVQQQQQQQQEQLQQQLQQQQLSAPPSEDAESPTRRRVLLTKKSMTFSAKSYHSDDEPSPPREFLPPKMQRAATIQIDQQPLPPAVRKLSGQFREAALPVRRRQQSPPIRAPPAPVIPRTPSPDRSPPPPSPSSDDDGPFELVSTPQHYIILQPPQADDGSAAASLVASPTQELADQILASMNNASPSPVKRPRHTLSLAERTRLSMARAARVGGGARAVGYSDEEEGENGDVYDDENEIREREQETLAIGRNNTNSASLAVRTKGVNSKAASRRTVGGKEDKAVEAVPEETETAPATDGSGGGGGGGGGYEDLVARTRKSMAGFEAARQKAQLDRRRSQRKSRQSSLGVGGAGATSTATSRREAAAHGGYFPTVNEGEGDGADEEEDTTMLAEELMSGGQDDAEAIFRSRPKIKMSPIPSPTRELEFE